MKIALCLSGQPRSYKKAYEFVKANLLDRYSVDVFLHTWENPVYNPNDVIDLYKPVEYMIEPPLKGDFDSQYKSVNPVKHPPRFTISYYYSMWQSCFLKIKHETATKAYDWVVRSRFDYALNGIIPFDGLPRDRKIFIPDCRMVPARDFGNDQFAFGRTDVMNDYMSTYLRIRTYYDSGQGYLVNGEDMMQANLRHHGLVGNNLVYVNMNNPFPPGPYNGTPHSLVRDDMELWKGL
jgi:hypothetical protein